MSHSERKNPWFGRSYIQHYDDAGKKIGKSFDKKNIITGKVKTIHTDQANQKLGSSERIEDALTGKVHTQNYDKDGNPTSFTQKEKSLFGREKWVTRSGKKRTTQELAAYLVMIGIAIYVIVKVVLPLTFVLITPILTVVSLITVLKSRSFGSLKYSFISSLIFILDYVFEGYSSYLVEDESFISENLHIFLLVAFICFGISLVGLTYNKLSDALTNMNVQNRHAQNSIALLLVLLLVAPFYLIENKHLKFQKMERNEISSQQQFGDGFSSTSINSTNEKRSGNMIYTGEDSLLLDSTESFFALKFVDVFYCGMYNYLIFEKDNRDSIDFYDAYDLRVYINEDDIDFDNNCVWTGNEVKLTTKLGNQVKERFIRRNVRYKTIVKYFGQDEGTLYKNSGYTIVDILPFGEKFPRQNKYEINAGVGQSMFQANARVNGSAVQLRSDHSTTAQSLKSMKKNDVLQIIEEYVPSGNNGQAILNQKVDFYDEYYSNVSFSLPKGKAVMVEGQLGGNICRISYYDIKTKTKGYAKINSSALDFISGKAWYRVKREDGLTGWVYSEFVDKM